MFDALTAGTDTGPALAPVVLVLLALGLLMNFLPLSWRDATISGTARVPAAGQALILAAGTMFLFALSQEGTAPFIYFQF